MLTSWAVRVLLDYRPALKQRSGVGEYTHQMARALLAAYGPAGDGTLELTLFSSSWKDRLVRDPELAGADVADKRVPVSVLNLAWHRLELPTAERLTGRLFDVTHSMHPLLLPSRSAAQVITIHDLNFLAHPERTRAEIRRDYPALARAHAHRAAHVVVPSKFTAGQVVRQLGVEECRISVCYPGAPDWEPRDGLRPDGYVLFFGTLEPRKNVGCLLDAYERLAARRPRGRATATSGSPLPPLVLAGQATEESREWLDRIAKPPLAGLVRHQGYVDPSSRRQLYEGARLLVQPSFEEGFGLPVLEAMTLGVPVVAASRGALPEVLGDAGLLVDPEQPDELANGIERLLDDEILAGVCASRGPMRARHFRWEETARRVYGAYQLALDHHRCVSA
ncbi:MAG: glycosyltransferase family 4 protein [Betaproteobacteria bacterium]